jgi:superfamily II DNA/RNA helicase
VDVIVGTPAKIVDLFKQGAVDLSAIRFFILDEADRLVDGDNLPMVLELFNACPAYGKGIDRLQVSTGFSFNHFSLTDLFLVLIA